jgi:hypothetical protein
MTAVLEQPSCFFLAEVGNYAVTPIDGREIFLSGKYFSDFKMNQYH